MRLYMWFLKVIVTFFSPLYTTLVAAGSSTVLLSLLVMVMVMVACPWKDKNRMPVLIRAA